MSVFSIKQIDLIGVCSDLGANYRGSNMGPMALRAMGLKKSLEDLGLSINDLGNLHEPLTEHLHNSPTNLLNDISDLNLKLKSIVSASIEKEHFPLILGGDHSLAIGSLAGISEHYKSRTMGLIWVDTHADIHTPITSETKNIHGMPIAALLQNSYPELNRIFPSTIPFEKENIALIGLRDIDYAEKQLLKESGIIFYTMRDIDEKGIQKVFSEISEQIIKRTDGFHLSFDLDVMDPFIVPGVSTAVSGGLNLREAHLLLELLNETGKITSADFVELNPLRDQKGQSAQIAVDLILSIFGKKII